MDDLREIREIETLKARYCRYVDTKQWSKLETIFSDDLLFENPDREIRLSGAATFVNFVSTRHANSTSVHVVSMPEIRLSGPTEADGIWAMSDFVIFPSSTGRITQRGCGHYTEKYLKKDGEWRISRVRLTRLWIETAQERLGHLN